MRKRSMREPWRWRPRWPSWWGRTRAWLVVACSLAAVGGWAAPAQAVTYSQQTLPFTGLASSTSVAVDAAGDVFVVDAGNNRVVELPAGGSQQTLPFTGLASPTSVAVDAAGDVFVVDAGNNRVVELPAGGSQQTLPFTGLASPTSVAVDAAGDVFVVDAGNNRVVELPAGGSQQTLPFTGLASPTSVAVDAAGDVFVVDAGNNRVVELPAGGSQQTLPFTGLASPTSVAVDAAGDVFVVDAGNNRVVELPAGGSQQTLPFTGLASPTSVAVDAAGDVFVAEAGNSGVVRLSPAVPSGSLALSRGLGPAGSGIGVSSLTPCPLGGAFGSTGATLALYSPTGALLQTANATLDESGDWSGTLSVPASAADGTTYFVGAGCHDSHGVLAQDYAYGTFAVAAPSSGATGPAGPGGSAGPAGPQGPPGNTPTNGTNGTAISSGCGSGVTTASIITCNLVWNVTTNTLTIYNTVTIHYTTNTMTIHYSSTAMDANARVEATTNVHGRRQIVGRGTIRRHKLKLTLKHLHRGRYRLTLLKLKSHGRSEVIGHITLTVR